VSGSSRIAQTASRQLSAHWADNCLDAVWAMGTTQASLAGTPPHSTVQEWHMVWSSQHNNTYEELVEGCGASSGLDVTMGKWGATQVSPDGVVVQTIGVQGKCI